MESEAMGHIIKLTGAVGELSGSVKSLESTTAEGFRSLNARMDKIENDGCALGKSNQQRIVSLEAKIARISAIGLIIISAVFGTDKLIKWWTNLPPDSVTTAATAENSRR